MSTFAEPSTDIQKRNFRYVQIDGVGVSIANVAAPFLPVFLTRLGATNFQVGLLSSMPGVTGFLLALMVGRFLQTRKNVVPWYSVARLMVLSCFTLTGILTLFLPDAIMITSTLAIWAFATIPSVAVNVAFSVVMNAVAGPTGRYALLSRRWAIFGLTGVVGTFLVTRVINLVEFPTNYSYMFLGLSVGGLISYFFSRKIQIPDQPTLPVQTKGNLRGSLRTYREMLRGSPAFLSFVSKRFVYFFAIFLAAPVMPLFLVRKISASDAEIGSINMVFTLVMLLGYFIWPRFSMKRGGRFVLLATTLGMALYPSLSAFTTRVELIMVYAGIAGFFQAGLDLVFFDELMKTVPADYSATFVSLAQSIQYISVIIAPMVGTLLADSIGLGGALLVSAGMRVVGFLLFLIPEKKKAIAG